MFNLEELDIFSYFEVVEIVNLTREYLSSCSAGRFCCVVLAYIAGGLLVNKYARGHEGRDIFPNVTFWSDLPYLVKVTRSLVFLYFSERLVGLSTFLNAILIL